MNATLLWSLWVWWSIYFSVNILYYTVTLTFKWDVIQLSTITATTPFKAESFPWLLVWEDRRQSQIQSTEKMQGLVWRRNHVQGPGTAHRSWRGPWLSSWLLPMLIKSGNIYSSQKDQFKPQPVWHLDVLWDTLYIKPNRALLGFWLAELWANTRIVL